jgi:hypothetical protein
MTIIIADNVYKSCPNLNMTIYIRKEKDDRKDKIYSNKDAGSSNLLPESPSCCPLLSFSFPCAEDLPSDLGRSVLISIVT